MEANLGLLWFCLKQSRPTRLRRVPISGVALESEQVAPDVQRPAEANCVPGA